MTTDRAIEIIKTEKDRVSRAYAACDFLQGDIAITGEEIKTAYDMAITALNRKKIDEEWAEDC